MRKSNKPTECLRARFVIWIKYCVFLLSMATLVSGCGGGTKPDGGNGGGGDVLGALVIAGIIWGTKEALSSGESKKLESNDNSEMYLVPITNSVYEKWNYIGGEPREFGVYTYVLFGKYPTQGEPSELFKKYKAILNIVQGKPYWPEYKKPISSNDKDRDYGSDIDTENMNVYLIPVSERHKQRIVTISDYNFDFSMRVLRRVLSKRVALQYRDKFLSEGPFLISMPREIQNNWKQYMLFADLTNVSEDMFLEIFNSYEKSLKSGSSSTNDPFGILENIRIDLGQKLVELNSVFKVIGEAYTEE